MAPPDPRAGVPHSLLSRAVRLLAAAPEPAHLLGRLAALVAPEHSDFCLADLLEPPDLITRVAAVGRDGPLRLEEDAGPLTARRSSARAVGVLGRVSEAPGQRLLLTGEQLRAMAASAEPRTRTQGELALAQATVYLATAPKSNALYTAYKAATKAAQDNGSLAPPRTILNAPTKLMKRQGYGDGYRYDHDEPDAFSGQDYWPEKLGRQRFYEPTERGFERDVGRRLDWWEKLRQERRGEE